MMKATQILMDKHRLVERVLGALQVGATQLEMGEELQPAFFLNAALFIRGFADGCHYKKEEGILFMARHAAGIPAQGGPGAVMLAEHEQGRACCREMRAAEEKWEKRDLSACPSVVHNDLGYVQLLHAHIYKEDNILFPMADKVIPKDRQDQVADDFNRLELEDASLRLKCLTLGEVLEGESTRQL
jgi:hemerythrin-like domain-containing protein